MFGRKFCKKLFRIVGTRNPCRIPSVAEIGFQQICAEDKWRRDRDSNPGYLAVYTLSKRAPSATRPSLRSVTVFLNLPQCPLVSTPAFCVALMLNRYNRLMGSSAELRDQTESRQSLQKRLGQ